MNNSKEVGSQRDSASSATHGKGPDSVHTLRSLLPRHLPQLEVYVRRHLGRTLRDRESACDLLHSVCGDLLAEGVAFEYRNEAQFQGWLRAAVMNKIKGRLRFLRAKKRGAGAGQVLSVDAVQLAAAPVERASPSQHAMLREDLGLLDRALAVLPAHYREVIVRTHLRGEPRAQVAASLGRTMAATGNLLTRALVKLAGEMDRLQHGGEGLGGG